MINSKITFNVVFPGITDMLNVSNEIEKEKDKLVSVIEKEAKKYEFSEEKFKEELRPWFRVAIKTIFSIIDAVCFQTKKHILIVRQEIKGESIDKKTKEKLQEFRINEKGKKEKIYLRIKENIKFTLKELYKLYGNKLDLSKDYKELNLLKKSIVVRNSITHPKKIENLEVGAEDYQDAVNVLHWFSEKFGKGLKGKVKITGKPSYMK